MDKYDNWWNGLTAKEKVRIASKACANELNATHADGWWKALSKRDKDWIKGNCDKVHGWYVPLWLDGECEIYNV